MPTNLVWRRVVLLFSAIAIVLLAGTIGFVWIENYPWFDAFYMTLMTITTVGYGEVHPLSRSGRIFNSFLIFFGASTMFLAIGLMTTTLIELQLGEFFGKRRIKRMINNLENHFIVCGFGRVGRGAASELQRSGAPFVVVDKGEDNVEWAIRSGMLAVLADSTRDETLKEVRIDRARGLIAALSTDADNLFLTLSAKTLNPMLNVSARAAEDEAEQKLRRAGADAVFAPYSFTGARLAQAILRPHVTQFLDFTSQNIGIEQVRVAETCEFVAKSLKDLKHLRKELGVSVLAIRKAGGQMVFNPPADQAIDGGDFLIVMGDPEALRQLERLLAEVRV